MQIQAAIDRVSIEKAIEIIREIGPYVDIVEIGTSLIKDFGMESVRRIRAAFPELTILADIKTIDEAEYEFRAAYDAGADLATVMGASAVSSIRHCQRTAREYDKKYVIDLLEVSDEKMKQLEEFTDAVFCIHLASDDQGEGLEELIRSFMEQYGTLTHIAAAGGVTLDTLPVLIQCGIEIAVVGGAITKADHRSAAADSFVRLAKSLSEELQQKEG